MKSDLYEQDYYLWLEKTINFLENNQFSDLDLENLIEEIKSISISKQKALKSNLSVILWHLLKYLQEPEKQTRSWALNLFEHRERIEEDLENSPSLKSFLTEENFKKCYNKARKSRYWNRDKPREIPERLPIYFGRSPRFWIYP